jgi:hypothetical protein
LRKSAAVRRSLHERDREGQGCYEIEGQEVKERGGAREHMRIALISLFLSPGSFRFTRQKG